MDINAHKQRHDDFADTKSAPLSTCGNSTEANYIPSQFDNFHVPQTRSCSKRTLLATSTLSFICGALVWHFIGFWSFVSGIVFNSDEPQPMIVAPRSTNEIVASSTSKSPNARIAEPSSAKTGTAIKTTSKATDTITGDRPPQATAETLSDLLQCAEARKTSKSSEEVSVLACPPMRRRLPHNANTARANRQLDAREAARRLADGWQTGVAIIETGSLSDRR